MEALLRGLGMVVETTNRRIIEPPTPKVETLQIVIVEFEVCPDCGGIVLIMY